MKYGKYWKTQIADLPPQLQKTSLSYKNWKKIEGNSELYNFVIINTKFVITLLPYNCIIFLLYDKLL
jgi:hypothetical protein